MAARAVRINLGTVLCVVLSGVAGSAPAHGAHEHADAALISTAAPPVGVRSIWYYQDSTGDTRAELRELRAARRDASRARTALALAEAAAVVQSAAALPEAAAASATVAGAVAQQRARSAQRSGSSQRARSSQRAGSSQRARSSQRPVRPARPAKARTGPGRQLAVASTWTPAAGGGVVGFALAQVGKSYGFGSTGPDRFDCSGLVAAAFRQIGISLPHQTGALAGVGRPVGRGELRPGDLVFPSTGHVGIYVGGGRIVHASTERGGVKLSPIYAFRFARRVA